MMLEVIAKNAAHYTERHRIETRVEECQHKTNYSPDVPKVVIGFRCARIEVVPQHKDLDREEAVNGRIESANSRRTQLRNTAHKFVKLTQFD